MKPEVFICDAVRTPIGRYGGVLSGVRVDDLAAAPIVALVERNPDVDWLAVDDVILGCANQAGEDNRNIARMATLLSGLSTDISGTTVNRLCGSGMDAIAYAARSIMAGEGHLYIAGGAESMSRAPFVMAKSDKAFSRDVELYDTTIGWRFVNPKMKKVFGVDPLGVTAENVADDYGVTREEQDAFAVRSQQKAARALENGRLATEIVSVTCQTGRDIITVSEDEHPRPDVTLEKLAKMKPVFREGGSVTAGNSSGVNDGAAAMIVASKEAVQKYKLTPRARIVAASTAGVPPRIMGMGPVPATRKLLERTGLDISQIDIFELNEAFASQSLACMRELGLPVDADFVNPNGGAIALGHPLGMSGARIIMTAVEELQQQQLKRALCTMCIGVGQGIAMLIERV